MLAWHRHDEGVDRRMSQNIASTKDEVLRDFRSEYEQLRARVRENKQLIDQSQHEVERLRERNVAIGAQIRRIESNFDTIPRADIKAAYDDARDAQTRLLTMQGQLEKLKSNQEEMEYFEQLIGRLLSFAQGVAPERLAAQTGQESPAIDASHLSTQAVVRIVEAQEVERQRLARQMHDGPAQSLTNFILQAEICQRLFDRNPDRAGDELKNLKVAAGTTFQKVRDFIFDLRPMMLDDLGLVPTLRRYVEAFQEKTSINTQLRIVGDERRLPGHIEVMMFRSVQGIMGAARDHLGARNIAIVLDVGPERLKATVEHDGRGFDPRDALEGDPHEEDVLGLRTLRERIGLVGGGFEVSGGDDEVSHYVITLPVMD